MKLTLNVKCGACDTALPTEVEVKAGKPITCSCGKVVIEMKAPEMGAPVVVSKPRRGF